MLTRSQVAAVVKRELSPGLKAMGFAASRMTLPGWIWVASNGVDAVGVWYQITTFSKAFYLDSLSKDNVVPCAVRIEVGPTRRGDDMYEQATVRGMSDLPQQLASPKRVELEQFAYSLATAAWEEVCGEITLDERESIRMGTAGSAPFFPMADQRGADLWSSLVAPEVRDLAVRWQRGQSGSSQSRV